jgi:hypothetical protein
LGFVQLYRLDLPCKSYPPWIIKGGVEGVLNLIHHHTKTHTGCRVVVRKEARTCLNHRVSHVPLFIASMSTPSLKSSHKSTTISFVRTMTFQSTTMFLPGSRWFLDSLEFLTDKFGNLILQEPELSKTGLCLPRRISKTFV